WHALYQVVPPDDPVAIEEEINHQLGMFRVLMRCDPTHIDSHQHVHRSDPVRTLVAAIGDRLGVPCRGFCDRVSYHGGFYGQTREGEALDDAISIERLASILKALPAGTSEISCHPGLRGDAPGMYINERAQEARVLCDSRVRAAIEAERIDLISYRELEPTCTPQKTVPSI